MQAFELYNVNRVVFGRGTVRRVGELAATLASRFLVIHNGPAVEEKLSALLAASNVAAIFRRQRGEAVSRVGGFFRTVCLGMRIG